MSLHGKRVVVTGLIANESRQTAEHKLRCAGALVQAAVTGSTDMLIVGAKVGQTKLNKARALGVPVVAWDEAFDEQRERWPDVEPGPITDESHAVRQIGPMLAKAGELPEGLGWVYEVKWDGYRCVATVRDGRVTMQSRSGKTDYAEQFPEIARALSRLPDCVLDGELVVLDDQGDSSFERMGDGAGTFVLFDVLEMLETDLRREPWTRRRQLLETFRMTIPRDEPLQLSPAFDDGEKLLGWASDRKLEGIVAKRRSAPYREGSRNGDWIKVKIRCEQELAVIGWKPGEIDGAAGSLLLAYAAADGRLEFCGRVGTGMTLPFWQSILELPRTDTSRYWPHVWGLGRATAAELRDVVWLVPQLVVQVRFQRWTEDGRLWHPSVVGVRTDKTPAECLLELGPTKETT